LAGDEGRGRLLSALAQPQWPHHRTLQSKAALLPFGLNKNHPYIDGNKRLALASMLAFLYLNDARLIANDGELEALALGIASGRISLEETSKFISQRCVRLRWAPEQLNAWFNRRTISDRLSIAGILIHDPAIAGPLADLLHEHGLA
jgi:death-on-curing family protein